MKRNLTHAHRQLFSRPPDECYPSLDALHERCRNIRTKCTSVVEPVEQFQPVVHDGSLALRVNGFGARHLNDWSFTQLCGLAGASKDTVNRLRPDTARQVLDELLGQRTAKPTRLQALSQNRSIIRAVNGERYSRLWNEEVLTMLKEYATDFTPPQKGVTGGTGLYAGEQDMFCFLIDSTCWVEIGGEAFAPGFFVWNSEVGCRTVGVSTFWFQSVCANHIVWDAVEVQELSRRHTKNVGDALGEIRTKIESLVKKRDERKDGFAKVIRQAMTQRLGDNAEHAIEKLVKHGFSRLLAQRATKIAIAKGRLTIWSVVDALTQLAREHQFAGSRLDADQKAAKLLSFLSNPHLPGGDFCTERLRRFKGGNSTSRLTFFFILFSVVIIQIRRYIIQKGGFLFMPGELKSILFDIGKVIEGATIGDQPMVAAYALQLSNKLEIAGEINQAKKIRKLIHGTPSGQFELAYAKAEASHRAVPIDLDSNLPTADVEAPSIDEVCLFLPREVERVVTDFVTYVDKADRLKAKGVGISASMLIYGPPGCGKTQLARWIAGKLSLPLITARTDGLISSYLGSTAKNIRQLFDHAMARPCILFLDEFDAIAKMRDDAAELGELKRIVISLLQNIDAMEKDHILLAATNHEHLLDKAIWRRFGYRVHLAEPDAEARRKMLSAFLGSFATDDAVELLLVLSDGLSGSNLQSISEECIRRAVISDADSVSVADAVLVTLSNHPNVTRSHSLSIRDQVRQLRRLNPKAFTEARLGKVFGKSQPQIHRYLKEKDGAKT